jgi:pyruvate,water dikinase
VSQSLRLLILGGEMPPDLRRDILNAAQDCGPGDSQKAYYAVRSSAVGEDGEMSFAGLYDSFLDVPFHGLVSHVKKVLASLYNPASLEYRLERQLPFTDLSMAVVCQQMAASRVAGVAYTLDPNAPREGVCVLGASWGLGRTVVEGLGAVDTFRLSRHPPHEILVSRIGDKEEMVPPFESDRRVAVPPELRRQPCLTPAEASRIVETALSVERFFKRPMDIEWSLDREGRLSILQARPLGIARGNRARGKELKAFLARQTPLLENRGVIAYRGIAAGRVWQVTDDQSLERFPSGAVLVSRHAIPLLARAIPRAGAVITDVGSPTGHMATVAREFRVPTIVDAGTATEILQSGMEVTVDAERNVVYAGRIAELLHHQLLQQASFETTYEFQLLRRLLKWIAPLALLDPQDPNFTVAGCRTVHDLLRFMHERSTQALARMAQDPHFLRARGGKRLKADIPLDLIVIDIGGGLAEGAGKSATVDPRQIASLPMKALWQGLSAPESWSTQPVSADFKGLMSSLTRTRTAAITGQGPAGLNVAVLGANYLNLSLRVGYHFTVVDASLGPRREKNSIQFRFFGGATDITRRSRRAALLLSITEKIGFKVEGKGDLVIARAVNTTVDQGSDYLCLVGRLIGFARQLDILMKDDAAVDLYCRRFMATCRMEPGNSQGLEEESI